MTGRVYCAIVSVVWAYGGECCGREESSYYQGQLVPIAPPLDCAVAGACEGFHCNLRMQKAFKGISEHLGTDDLAKTISKQTCIAEGKPWHVQQCQGWVLAQARHLSYYRNLSLIQGPRHIEWKCHDQMSGWDQHECPSSLEW